MASNTGWVWHEAYAWHDTGTAAGYLPAGGWLQPHENLESGDSKRRFAELVAVSGLGDELQRIAAQPATVEDLLRFHAPQYVEKIRRLSADAGGDAGELTPFGKGSWEIACLSAGGCIALLDAVWSGRVRNGYSLNRPPGHHADADLGRGYCIFGNAVVAIRNLQARCGVARVAVVDWDVHHGNGTQGGFYEDPSVLTISLHQDGNYPAESGSTEENGRGAGLGCNVNVPLPAGSGTGAYLSAFERVVLPALERFRPEIIVVLSGFDACNMDPLGRMMLHSNSYRELTRLLLDAAERLCGGRLAMFHEGGYSPVYVPFCGVAVLEELSGRHSPVVDPFLPFWENLPGQRLQAHQEAAITRAARLVDAVPVPA